MKLLARSVLFLGWLLGIAPAYAGCNVGSVPFNLQNGTLADATQVMANFNSIVTGAAAGCAASGANSDITALLGLTTPITLAQGGGVIFLSNAQSTGTANAQVVAATTPSNFSLSPPNMIMLVPGFTNTGPMTLNVNSTGAQAVLRRTPNGAQALTGGEIAFGQNTLVEWDGSNYEIVNDPSQYGGFGQFTNLASAPTTDLGTVPGHNINITGTTTITSFGSTAVTTYPIYRLNFGGVLQLTYNGTSLILPGGASIITAVGDSALALYLGSGNWEIVAYQRLAAPPGNASLGGANTLSINRDATVTSIDVGFSQAVAVNAQGFGIPLAGTSFTINSATNGVNGLDTGSRAGSTWYNIYIISNGVTAAGLLSLSATAPTLPAGYNYFVRVGAMFVNSGNTAFVQSFQRGSVASYGALSTGFPTLPSASGTQNLSALIPPTAVAVDVTVLSINSPGDVCQLGPNTVSNNQVGVIVSTANTFDGSNAARIYVTTAQQIVASGSSNTCNSSAVTGWVDGGVNAN